MQSRIWIPLCIQKRPQYSNNIFVLRFYLLHYYLSYNIATYKIWFDCCLLSLLCFYLIYLFCFKFFVHLTFKDILMIVLLWFIFYNGSRSASEFYNRWMLIFDNISISYFCNLYVVFLATFLLLVHVCFYDASFWYHTLQL